MNRVASWVISVLLLSGGLIVSGCSNKPSEEELRLLNDLKAQVS